MRAAVLLIAFNRPRITERVFQTFRKARPKRLYVAVDGPRPHVPDDINRVAEVVKTASVVDWDCQVQWLLRTTNIGCKYGVSTAIDWFFKQETEGIILEDDCLPTDDFFAFCEFALERYRHDRRIWSITGDNFQRVRRGKASYYFSRYPHIWGWATWKRCWDSYDVDMDFWPRWRSSKDWRNRIPDSRERDFWTSLFDKTHRGEIDTWDFQWVAAVWRAGGLTVTPEVNLVTNIGFGTEATHTKNENSPFSIASKSLMPIDHHPSEIQANHEADRYVFENVFLAGRKTRNPVARVLENGWRILRAKAGFARG